MPAKDITGQRFGKLVAKKATERRSSGGSIVWQCFCDCGSVVNVSQNSLQQDSTKSCGCLFRETLREKARNDIIERRFGRLTVLELISKRASFRRTVWKCLCDCGNTYLTSGLRSGHTRSCGCLKIASEFVRGTNINSMDVPFEITNVMKTRRELKKAIKQAS